MAKISSKNTFRQLFFNIAEVLKLLFKVQPFLLIALLILNVLMGLSAFPGIYLDKYILDLIITSIGKSNLSVVIRTLVSLLVLKMVVDMARSLVNRVSFYIRRLLSEKFHYHIDLLMARKLAELDIATIEDHKFKNKFTKIRQESGRLWDLVMPLSDLLSDIVGFVSATAILFSVHFLIAIGIIVISLPQFFIDRFIIKKEYKLSSELAPLHKTWGWLNHYLLYNRNFLELKLLDLQDYLAKKLEGIQNQVIDKRVSLRKQREVWHFAANMPFEFYHLFVSILLLSWVLTQRITIGSFQLYLRTLGTAQTHLNGLVGSLLRIYENSIYVNDIIWFLSLKPKISADAGDEIQNPEEFSIKFNHVWFRYKKSSNWIIRDMNFEISPKENIAIVGVNGAGKSTLIKLLARYYDPQKGNIYVNGQNLSSVKPVFWRKCLAILFQEFETYPFSAKDAIGYGDVEKMDDLEKIKNAAKKTGIDSYISGLPLGYDNPLDPDFPKGVRPSAGQRQRVGLSRMLFRDDAKVIILDEPTSNVDPEAEEKIFNEIVSITSDKTVIFVTQRFSTARLADRIFVVDNGQIIEMGTHSELMKIEGRYHDLFKLQAKGYK